MLWHKEIKIVHVNGGNERTSGGNYLMFIADYGNDNSKIVMR